ncbi:FliG C-terminal domain-containing protein [Shumkonia mesophila]|uniref:FliG C-terminal domain-containing protein n=1 Tax=Shumkonia mesophila TaxID=2838854 RepID=UPI002934F9D8|nr:FliG C-terminal domain-containing protein [Shumkonia mesophila]
MKISVEKAPQGGVTLAFDDTCVALNAAETKTLLLELTRALVPGPAVAVTARKLAERVADLIKAGGDIGIQRLLRVAEHDDLLVLLKFGEGDARLLARIYGNMTEKSRRIYAEDLAYRFKDGVPEDLLGRAANRLAVAVRDLEEEGAFATGPQPNG